MALAPNHWAWSSPPCRSSVTVALFAFWTLQTVLVPPLGVHPAPAVMVGPPLSASVMSLAAPPVPREIVTLLVSLPVPSVYVTRLPLTLAVLA